MVLLIVNSCVNHDLKVEFCVCSNKDQSKKMSLYFVCFLSVEFKHPSIAFDVHNLMEDLQCKSCLNSDYPEVYKL